MNQAEVTVTRTVYEPSPTPNSPYATTVTVTVEPSSSPLSTRTIGTPWTTATPREYTTVAWMGGMPTPYVVKSYPPQPKILYCSGCRNPTKGIVGAAFGGLGGGLFICLLVFIFMYMRLKRAKRALKHARGGRISPSVYADAGEEQRGKSPLLGDAQEIDDPAPGAF